MSTLVLDPMIGAASMQAASWLVALAIPFCFLLAMGMGANDVGNAFGTSVGSKVLNIKQACVIAAIFDFAGAVALGSGVASTMQGGIVDPAAFDGQPQLLMLGNWTAVVGAWGWILFATIFGLPVSSTQAIVGAILGFGLVETGGQGINVMGIVKIVISWFASPILAGLVTAGVLWTARYFVVSRESTVALRAARWYVSAVVSSVFFLASIFIIYGAVGQFTGTFWDWAGALIALAIGTTVFLFLFFAPWGVDLLFQLTAHMGLDTDSISTTSAQLQGAAESDIAIHVEEEGKKNKDLQQSSEPDLESEMDARAIADEKETSSGDVVETRFAGAQICTASYMAFSHGANDVANVAGPMAAVWALYQSGETSTATSMATWILVLMAFGVVVGLWFFGQRVIETIGKNMTKVTPSAGFAVQMGTATTVLVGSFAKIPLSTTHACVGSVVAVGLMTGEGKKAVNWKLFGEILLSWFVTVPVAGGISALLYWALRPVVQSSFIPVPVV